MPYKVTAERNNKRYTAIIAKKMLPYTIVKNLVALKLDLTALQNIVKKSNSNPLMIVCEATFNQMVAIQPGLDMLYESIILHNNSRIYYHTNWAVGKNSWQLMAKQLEKLAIKVATIEGKDPTTNFKEISHINPKKQK